MQTNGIEVRKQMQRILSDSTLKISNSPSRFLNYVVDQSLNGRSKHIKAYSIAVDALGKPPCFDPQNDSTIRVLAGRVRKILNKYYKTSGLHDPIIISVPVGSYVPKIQTRPKYKDRHSRQTANQITKGLQRDNSRTGWLKPENFVPVLAFTGSQNGLLDPELEKIATILDNELLLALSKWEPIKVADCRPSSRRPGMLGKNFPAHADLELMGKMDFSEAGEVRTYIQLSKIQSHECIWFHSFVLKSDTISDQAAIVEMAQTIAGLIVQPFGLVSRNSAIRSTDKTVDDLTAYECVLQTLNYYSDANENSFNRALLAAKNVVKRHPEFALGWAALADLYCEKYRIAYGGLKESASALDDASHCARQATLLNSQSAYGHLALSNINFARGRLENGIKFGERALELNPGNHNIAAKFGHQRAYAGDWKGGCEILSKAIDQQLIVNDYAQYALAEDAFRNEEYGSALSYLEQVKSTDVYYQPMFKTAIYTRMGLKPEAQDCLRILLEREPGFNCRTLRNIMSRDVNHQYIDLVEDAVREAGLSH